MLGREGGFFESEAVFQTFLGMSLVLYGLLADSWSIGGEPTVLGRHTGYTLQGCVIHRGITNTGLESSWCRPNQEFRRTQAASK